MADPWASYDEWLQRPYMDEGPGYEEPESDPDDLRDRALDREYGQDGKDICWRDE